MNKASLLCALLLASSTAACGKKDSDGTSAGKAGEATGKGGSQASTPAAKPSARLGKRAFRPLLKEALRAELDQEGIAIDFGTADQHKYTRGGWATGWGDTGTTDQGISYATTSGKASKLNVWIRYQPAELVLRARTKGGEGEATVGLSVGKNKLGESIKVGADWSVQRVPLGEASLKEGREQLVLSASSEVEIDWLWLPQSAGAEEYTPLPRTLPIKLGDKSRRALTAPSARSYSFYLHAPKDGQLVVDVGSDQDVEFVVRAHSQSGVKELLKTKADRDSWREEVIDLGEFADQAIRLELATVGPKGKTGWGEPEILVPEPKTRTTLDKKAKNLVYVVMDTTRADAFASVNPKAIVETPNYDAWAAKSTTFKNAYNNENWTKPSVTTMWSGLYPGTHGAREATSKVDESIRFLPQQLQDNGFTTGAFIANAVVGNTFGFNKGWTHFQNDSDHNLNGNGSRLYPNAAQWMEEHKDERFFLYVQSVDPHTTYEVPEDYTSKYFEGKYNGPIGTSFDRDEQIVVDNGKMKVSEKDMQWIHALYNGEVTYQDKYLGGLLDKIEELGLADDTLVVITNDHGEELKEHGGMGHGWPLFEEQIRAPLMMRHPGTFPEGLNETTIVEHADLAPTILDALGVAPMKSAEGMSFLPLIEDGIGRRQQPFYTLAWTRKGMRSVRVGDWKLITGKSSGWMYLFDLGDDPEEKKSLVTKGKAPSDEALLPGRLCEIYLAEALATPDKAKRLEGAAQKQSYDSREIPVDEKTRKELEALGYL